MAAETKVIPTILLNALPAGGKSEIRKLLRYEPGLSKACRLGEQVQLDDYPYVKFMRDIDDALEDVGEPRMFYPLPDRGFVSNREWGTLMHLINEDYDDLCDRTQRPTIGIRSDVAPTATSPTQYTSATAWLFQRIDRARDRVGITRKLGDLPARAMWALEAALEPSAKAFLDSKFDGIPDTLEGKTVFIEFSRGGPAESSFPLPSPHGYQYSYSQLSDRILRGAAVLYVWITPEMSRNKNIARGTETVNAPAPGVGSAEAAKYVLSLNHTVPQWVMFNAYGCDDMDHLLSVSGKPATVRVDTVCGKTYYLPVARFDNREDLTSFLRGKPEQWAEKDRTAIRGGLGKAFEELVDQFTKLHQ